MVDKPWELGDDDDKTGKVIAGLRKSADEIKLALDFVKQSIVTSDEAQVLSEGLASLRKMADEIEARLLSGS